jgi:hypothetical protein
MGPITFLFFPSFLLPSFLASFLPFSLPLSLLRQGLSQASAAHAYNPNYSMGGCDQEDCSSRPAGENNSQDSGQIIHKTPSPKQPEQNGLEV